MILRSSNRQVMLLVGLCCIIFMGPLLCAATDTNANNNQVFDLNFKGGTVVELISEVQKNSGKTPNVVINSDKAANFTVPAMQLRNVTIKTILSLLGTLSIEDPDKYLHTRIVKDSDGGDNDILVLNAYRRGIQVQKTFMIEDCLKKYSLDDIVTAIKTTWEMLAIGDKTQKLTFHEETSLLIVLTPTSEEMGVLENVLSELRKGLMLTSEQK